MKLLSIGFLFMILISHFSFALEPAADPIKQQEMMKMMKDYGTPGEGHKVLAQMAGKWTFTSRWWQSPTGKPEESKGASTLKMILGGRFLQNDTNGNVMGEPFVGLGFTGYDNAKKVYDTIWLDTMSTGVMKGTGSFDAGTKTLSDVGEFTCPGTDDKTATYRSEWKMIDKNNMVYTMYGRGMMEMSKDEFKMMEIIYKRSK